MPLLNAVPKERDPGTSEAPKYEPVIDDAELLTDIPDVEPEEEE